MSSKRTPPMLVDDDYDTWEKEIKLWQCVTDLEKKKQGPMVYLTLAGKARQCCADLDVAKLNSEDGLDQLMARMKDLYAKDEEQVAFLAYESFECFKRPADMNITDFINEFERRYSKIKAKKMELPDGVLAYRVLRSANLSEEHQTLARATIEKLSYDGMKKQIRAIFDKVGAAGRVSQETVAVKVEPTYHANNLNDESVFYTNQGNEYGNRYRNFNKSDHRGAYSSNLRRGGYNHRSRGGSRDGTKRAQKGRNPLDRYGNISKCAICQSTMHWVKDCPHAEAAEVKISLFTEEISNVYMTQFVGEALNAVVLDSGCSRTVCGEEWLKNYISCLSEADSKKVETEASDMKFKFGDGEAVQSHKKVTFPACIGEEKILITTNVIDKELPLLLSKDAMKKAATTIDFVNDRVTMLGKTVDLKFTSSGHYIVPITKNIDDIPKEELLVLINSSLEGLMEDKVKTGYKLHLQFGHARSHKIIDVIKDTGHEDVELFEHIKKAEENCEVCQRYKKTKARPAVGLPLARDFNDAVAMDLKWCNGVLCLHMIDHMTRFSSAAVVKSKKKEEIIDNIFKIWIALFGCPKKLLSDNGGEFNNELMRELGQLLNMRILSTAAEAPWSNGITERHNTIIGNMVEKIMKEVDCTINVALAWVVSAKNSLKNVYGYSPNQLVFGKNPNFPVVTESQLPALDGVTSSKLIADHINAMHAARKAFVAAESCDKLRRAMLRKTRTATSLIFEPGDLVYYKKNDSKYWRGVAEVMGKTGKQVWVKHGGAMFRVNPVNLRKARMHETQTNENDEEECLEPKGNNIDSVPVENRTDVFDTTIDKLMEDLQIGESGDEAEYIHRNDGENMNYKEPEVMEDENRDVVNDENLNSFDEPEHISTNDEGNLMKSSDDLEDLGDNNEGNPTIRSGEIPKNSCKIKYMLPNCDEWVTAKVISRAGKVSGTNKWWINIQHNNEVLGSIDLSGLKAWEYIDEEEVLLSSTSDKNEVLAAKLKELETWKSHTVYTEVIQYQIQYQFVG